MMDISAETFLDLFYSPFNQRVGWDRAALGSPLSSDSSDSNADLPQDPLTDTPGNGVPLALPRQLPPHGCGKLTITVPLEGAGLGEGDPRQGKESGCFFFLPPACPLKSLLSFARWFLSEGIPQGHSYPFQMHLEHL